MRKQLMKAELFKSLGIIFIFILMLSAFSGTAGADPGDVVWSSVQYYNDLDTQPGDTISFSCTSIEETLDGGCIVAGTAIGHPSYFRNRAYLMRFDEAGDTLWVRHYGWENFYYNASTVMAESDGGFVVAGDKQTPFYDYPPPSYPCGVFLIKVDTNGDTLWTRTYNDPSGDYRFYVRDACKTSDGGYAVFGFTISFDPDAYYSELWRAFILKVSADGTEQWLRQYEPPIDSDPNFRGSLMVGLNGAVADDGGYVIAGSSQMFYVDYNQNVWSYDHATVLKVDADGDTVWTYRYGDQDQIFTINSASDGGFIIGDMNRDLLSPDLSCLVDQTTVIKIDGSGNESWLYDIALDGSGDYHTGTDTSAVPRAVCEIPGNGGYVLAGEKLWMTDESPGSPDLDQNSQLLITLFDGNGDFKSMRIYEEEYGNPIEMAFSARDIKVKRNGNYLICGNLEALILSGYVAIPCRGIVTEIEAVTVSIDDEHSLELPEQVSLMQNYPNPFNATTQIQFSLNTPDDVTLSVYDLLGRKITTLYDGALNAGTHSIIWNGTNESGDVVSSGVYFYRLETSKSTQSQQMILLK